MKVINTISPSKIIVFEELSQGRLALVIQDGQPKRHQQAMLNRDGVNEMIKALTEWTHRFEPPLNPDHSVPGSSASIAEQRFVARIR